ncbi:MAG TPA: phospholipase D-like domain-containing protein, partial [Kofleriaceae bacterium]|nr:phospholipase D-like domain-containing protein [Kofleriaceae bacterium]
MRRSPAPLAFDSRAALAPRAALAIALAACGAAPAAEAPAARPSAPVAARSAQPAAFELVETVPVETTLDHPELRDAADVWLDMIAGARTQIDLAQFYASDNPGSRLEAVVVALEAAIARGVRVRFLAELGFVKTYPETLERLARAGASVRHLDLRKVPGGGGILHAKYFLVDDREAFLGSQNFDWRALEHNYELGARVRDPGVVGGLAAIFAADWARAGGEPAEGSSRTAGPLGSVTRGEAHAPAPSGSLTLVASPPELLPAGVAWDLPRIVQLLDGATASITVELLTYRAGGGGAAWDELEAPLVRAAGRGVKVQLLLADWSKRPHTITGLQKLARIPNIAVRLTTI